ncbi:hypothetical protein FDP41_007886 [Naegleria fowleri]|uniref:Uncharacterized protein n=1 Tax=Naegleria fowleri TaxID=5763 RepID=A0A6A5C9U7_NAEFO|nr:uncharacterized protein FDP41_007886 [Naegleria fowleri]KAF0983971.1 hypothetical protein FDP41_007886 [Naegleria fowleri]
MSFSTINNLHNYNHDLSDSSTSLDVHRRHYKYYDDGLYEEEQPCIIPNCNGINPNIKIDISQSMIIHSLQNIKLSDQSSSSSHSDRMNPLANNFDHGDHIVPPTPIHPQQQQQQPHPTTTTMTLSSSSNRSNNLMVLNTTNRWSSNNQQMLQPQEPIMTSCSKQSFHSSSSSVTTTPSHQRDTPISSSIPVTPPSSLGLLENNTDNNIDEMCEEDENFEYNDELNFLISNFDLSEEEKNKFMPYIY